MVAFVDITPFQNGYKPPHFVTTFPGMFLDLLRIHIQDEDLLAQNFQNANEIHSL